MPGLPSVQASTQGWASVGSMWSTSLNEDWLPEWRVGSTGGFTVPCSPSSSGYIFSSSGDGTTGSGNGFYALGRAVRVVQGVSTIYGPVATASVAAGVTTVGLSSDLATAALSTATAFTSVAVGTESGHSLAGSSGLSASLFHRGDGTWGAATVTLGTASADLAADVPLNANSYVDGPTIALTTGVWHITAGLTATCSGTDFLSARIWDGTSNYASGQVVALGGGPNVGQIGLSAVVTVTPAATFRLSATTNGTSGANANIKAAIPTNPAGNTASHIRAVKVAP